VYFDLPNHETVRVTVAHEKNHPFWSVGFGDFETHGDFNDFIDEIGR
jgi:uncharacterized protein YpmB